MILRYNKRKENNQKYNDSHGVSLGHLKKGEIVETNRVSDPKEDMCSEGIQQLNNKYKIRLKSIA